MSIDGQVPPSWIRVVVLVSRLDPPTLQALAWAETMRPRSVEALTVQVDPESSRRLMVAWAERGTEIPLTLVGPADDVVPPVLDYVTNLRSKDPHGLVAVFIPQYAFGRRWEYFLHHSAARRLRAALCQVNGIMVTTVPRVLTPASEAARSS